jgi:type I restriction enzyme S subunit
MTAPPAVELGDVAAFVRGITFKPDDVVRVGTPGAVACMRTKNVQAELDLSDVWGIPESFVRREDLYLIPGDMLVSSANSWNLVGKCCRVPSLPWRSTFGGFISVLRPNPAKVDPTYLFRWFASDRTQATVRSFGQQTTNISNLNVDRCLKLQLRLPPLPDQRRIAEILDKADALRATRRAALVQLDNLTQSIFIEMFGDPATNPKGWPQKSISDIATVITGNTPPRAVSAYYGSDIEWIKSDNINTPQYYLTRADEGLSTLGKQIARVAPAGSILVTCIAGSPECIGNAAMTDREVAFNQQINALVPGDADSHFIYVQLVVGKRLVQQASTSSMKGMVSKSRFERIMMMCPPLTLQREFASRVILALKLRASHLVSLSGLEALFVSLQQRAFQGEV